MSLTVGMMQHQTVNTDEAHLRMALLSALDDWSQLHRLR